MRSWLFALLVLVTPAWVLAQSPQPLQTPQPPGTADGISVQSGSSPSGTTIDQQPPQPIQVTVTAAPKTAEELNAEQRQNEQQAAREVQLNRYAGLLAVVGVLQVLVLICLAVIFRRQSKAARVIERGYVYVRGIKNYANYQPHHAPELTIVVTNSGNTPVRIIESGIATIPVLTVEDDLPRPMPDPRMYPSNIVLMKDQRIDWGNKLDIVSQDDFDRVFTLGFTLVVFGRIKYRDAFSVVHHTDFSFVYNPKQWGVHQVDFVIEPNGYSDAD